MAATSAMYALAVFQYNQLGDNDTALNQGVDVFAECEFDCSGRCYRMPAERPNARDGNKMEPALKAIVEHG